MTLEEHIEKLTRRQQFELALKFSKLVLPIWEEYADLNGTKYVDSVVGLTHCVEKSLLRNVVSAIETNRRKSMISRFLFKSKRLCFLRCQFDDPITALQDLDWELPDSVAKAFYSVYNFLEAELKVEKTMFGESTLYVAINQAIDCLESSKAMGVDQIHSIVYECNGR